MRITNEKRTCGSVLLVGRCFRALVALTLVAAMPCLALAGPVSRYERRMSRPISPPMPPPQVEYETVEEDDASHEDPDLAYQSVEPTVIDQQTAHSEQVAAKQEFRNNLNPNNQNLPVRGASAGKKIEPVKLKEASAEKPGHPISFFDLPASVRDNCQISISVLVYAKEPGKRSMIVNGKRACEGQDLVAGLKLEEITPDGAIFSINGLKFYKAIKD